MADDEREKAASALRGEQQRALDQAADEREKAAAALRSELARAMQEGDDRLREHISQQIMQIQAALVSAERLEVERFSASQAATQSVEEKLMLLQKSYEIAQNKFEHSVEGRFATVNEFRSALDDLGKQMATRRELEAAVGNLTDNVEKARNERQIQIEEMRATVTELRSRLDSGTDLRALQSRLDTSTGEKAGARLTYGAMAGLLAAFATIIGLLVIAANWLSGS